MDGLSAAASIFAVAEFAASVIAYVNDVKDASKEWKECRAEATSLNAALYQLEIRVGDATDDAWFDQVKKLIEPEGPLDQYKLALVELKAKIEKKTRLEKVVGALLWKFVKEDVIRLLDKVERVKSLISIALQIDHFKLSQAIEHDTSYIAEAMPEVHANIKSVSDALPRIEDQMAVLNQWQDLGATKEKHQELMNWLSPGSCGPSLQDILSRRTKGTGQWLFDLPEMQGFLSGRNKFVLCLGIPGAGKTVISGTVIEHLQEHHTTSVHHGLAYVFCDYKSRDSQSQQQLLAWILRQLLEPRPSLTKPLYPIMEQQVRRKTALSVDELIDILHSTVRSLKSIYLVIDALDECESTTGSRFQLIDCLCQLQDTVDLRIFCTSRNVYGIEDKFSSKSILQIRASMSDVSEFLTTQLNRLPPSIQHEKALTDNIVSTISEAVDGMFLLARLYLDSLRDKRTKKRVLDTLSGFAKQTGASTAALDAAYEEVWGRITSQLPEDAELARRALAWISCAKRPMRSGELCEALAIVRGTKTLDRDDVCNINDIVDVCNGLVTLEDTDIIRLSHYTTQDYLDGKRAEWFPDIEREVALDCLTYLQYDAFADACVDHETLDACLGGYSFSTYASSYWDTYVDLDSETIYQEVLHFLRRRASVAAAFRMMTGYRPPWPLPGKSNAAEGSSGLHFAAMNGKVALIKELLPDIDINTLDADGRTALHWAVTNAHVEAVRFLLSVPEVYVHVEAFYDRKWTRVELGDPLEWAIKECSVEITELLLSSGKVTKDPCGYRYALAIEQVVKANNLHLMTLLLIASDAYRACKAITCTSEVKRYQRWLGIALARGYIDFAELLLQRTTATLRPQSNLPPLCWAVNDGCIESTRWLLDPTRTVDVNKSDSYSLEGRPPLSLAVTAGRDEKKPSQVAEELVKMLLAVPGIDVLARDGIARTALCTAVCTENHTIAQILFDACPAAARITDNDGRTPLWHACRKGNVRLVRMLIEASGEVVSSRDIFGCSPLMAAVRAGSSDVVGILLGLPSIDLNAKDSEGRTPLFLAVYNQSIAIVQLLAKTHRVDAGVKGPGRVTPLQLARELGLIEVIEELEQVSLEK